MAYEKAPGSGGKRYLVLRCPTCSTHLWSRRLVHAMHYPGPIENLGFVAQGRMGSGGWDKVGDLHHREEVPAPIFAWLKGRLLATIEWWLRMGWLTRDDLSEFALGTPGSVVSPDRVESAPAPKPAVPGGIMSYLSSQTGTPSVGEQSHDRSSPFGKKKK